MGIRFALSTLTHAEARQRAARWLLAVCVVGYVVTLSVLFARGDDLRGWLFILLAWALFVYIPLRIVLEAFQTIAPRIRSTLVAETAGQPDRYASRSSIELLVDGMLDHAVVMPRIAKPLQRGKARDGAVAVLRQLGREDLAQHQEALTRTLATLDQWVADLAASMRGDAAIPIQARWADLRALIALAVLAKAVLAAYQDRAGAPLAVPGLQDRALAAYLDACLDYCDELALKVEALPWTEAPLGLPAGETTEDVRRTWKAFAETEPPALAARDAFVRAILSRPTAAR